MKSRLSLFTIVVLTSCLTTREQREWNSKKYPDNHFYFVLKQPISLDTTILKLNRIYTNKMENGEFSHLLFTNDQKVYSHLGQTCEINPENLINNQQLLGYFKTQHDTLSIEQIVISRFIFTKNGKGVFPTYRHLKINGIIKADSLLISSQPIEFKAPDRFEKHRSFRLN